MIRKLPKKLKRPYVGKFFWYVTIFKCLNLVDFHKSGFDEVIGKYNYYGKWYFFEHLPVQFLLFSDN